MYLSGMPSMPLLSRAFLLLAGSAALASAQSLDSTIELLALDAARGYISPITSGTGANLNSGWFHRAPPAEMFSPTFEAGFVAMFSSFQDAPKTFGTEGNFRFDKGQAEALVDPAYRAFESDPRSALLTPGQKQQIKDSLISAVTRTSFDVGISGPTVIGRKRDSIRVAFRGDSVRVHVPQTTLTPARDTTLAIPARSVALPVGGILEDLPFLPLAAPQITIGTIAGTNVTLRWLPEVQLTEELGKFSYFGFGIQHNPAMWLPVDMPFDVCGGFFTQRLTIGDVFTARTLALGINASKTLGWKLFNVTPYGGLMLEKSSMEARYKYRIDLPDGPLERTIRFEAEGANKARVTLGLSLRLLIMNLNLDYNVSDYDTVSLGFMIGV